MKNIEIIEDVLNDIKHTTNQLKGMIENLEHHLQQATKVEKLKAYHVTDEYDLEALKEELIKKGYEKDSAWGFNLDNVPLYLEWVGTLEYVLEIDKNLVKFCTKYDFEKVEDNYEVEEYKDERLFYARFNKIENIDKEYNFWGLDINDNTVSLGDSENNLRYRTQMTKTEWNKLGINDTNADFELVEEQ